MRRSRLVAVAVASLVALSVQGVGLTKTAGGSPSRTIVPPYDEAEMFADDVCATLSGNPQCEEDASASTSGSLDVRALIRDTSQLASESGSGRAGASALVRHYISNSRDKGRALTVSLSVEVPNVGVTTTAGNRAQVFLFATLTTTCLTEAFDDCRDSRLLSLADTSSAGSECPEACTITLSIQAPPDKPLGDGFVQLGVAALADLTSESSLLPEDHTAEASANVRLASIQGARELTR